MAEWRQSESGRVPVVGTDVQWGGTSMPRAHTSFVTHAGKPVYPPKTSILRRTGSRIAEAFSTRGGWTRAASQLAKESSSRLGVVALVGAPRAPRGKGA